MNQRDTPDGAIADLETTRYHASGQEPSFLDEPAEDHIGSNLRVDRGRIVLATVVGAAFVAGLVGWVLGSRLQSPEDAFANVAPPPPSIVAVPVEARIIATEISIRAEARLTASTEVLLAEDDVITSVTKSAGDQVNEGDVLVENRGRPIIALLGAIPNFRTFEIGMDKGPDVKQLEESLDRLGYDPGPIDTSFTTETAGAIERLYRNLGYEPSLPPNEELEALSDRASAVETARSDRQRAEEVYNQALVRLNNARLESEQINGVADETDVTIASTQFAVDQAKEKLDTADEILNEASNAYNSLRVTTGADFPQSELVFVAKLPAIVQSATSTIGRPPAGDEPFITISDGEQIITGSILPEAAGSIRTGDEAIVTASSLSAPLPARITDIYKPGQDEAGESELLVAIRTDEPLPPELFGESLLVKIPLDSTNGSVLVVPAAAIFSSGGTPQVQVARPSGLLEVVPIETGLSADGLVEIRPLAKEALQVGDRVVIEEAIPADEARTAGDPDDER